MLQLIDLNFAYPGQIGHYEFRLAVEAGEIVAIGGASGSGKSTLCDLIAGFLRRHSGKILLDGVDISGLLPEERPVSMLFQSDNLFDHLSAEANVRLGLSPETEAVEAQVAVENALGAVGLAGLGHRLVSALSGGQKQRVALARTLLLDRPVLLLDEPFTGLDSTTAATLRQLIRGLTIERGWHVILVSHDPEDRQGYADRTLMVEDGKLRLA